MESVKIHNPIKCHSKFETWGENGTGCPEPVFAGNPPMVYPNIISISNTSSISFIILMASQHVRPLTDMEVGGWPHVSICV